MSPLFEISGDKSTVRQLPAKHARLEQHLEKLIEGNLERVLGVRFVATQYELRGDLQQGRIDTLGLDADGSPTIIEYKREKEPDVINQGLYYLNWLKEHRGDFELLVKKKLGFDVEIVWSQPRLIVIAETFAKWDTYAVKLMGQGIELWRYVFYDDHLLFLEQVYGQQRTLPSVATSSPIEESQPGLSDSYTLDDHTRKGNESIRALFLSLRDQILSLEGEEGEIIETPRKLYVAYRHGKNFCEVEVQKKVLKVYVDIPYSELEDRPALSRDLASVGHWGTGTSLFTLQVENQIEIVMKAIFQSYLRTL
ncbi:MAG: hypothetical protein JNL34_08180 [Anaerolineae bacterium]|nr:hypothetical protein [Anaerolineae bacterium]